MHLPHCLCRRATQAHWILDGRRSIDGRFCRSASRPVMSICRKADWRSACCTKWLAVTVLSTGRRVALCRGDSGANQRALAVMRHPPRPRTRRSPCACIMYGQPMGKFSRTCEALALAEWQAARARHQPRRSTVRGLDRVSSKIARTLGPFASAVEHVVA
jgi:hypothetical protein